MAEVVAIGDMEIDVSGIVYKSGTGTVGGNSGTGTVGGISRTEGRLLNDSALGSGSFSTITTDVTVGKIIGVLLDDVRNPNTSPTIIPAMSNRHMPIYNQYMFFHCIFISQ